MELPQADELDHDVSEGDEPVLKPVLEPTQTKCGDNGEFNHAAGTADEDVDSTQESSETEKNWSERRSAVQRIDGW